MRNICTLLLLIMFSAGFSQSYKFNLLTNYIYSSVVNKKKSTGDNIIYSYSTDPTYFMELQKKQGAVMAYLWDFKTNKIHRFEVSVIGKGEDSSLNFSFLYTSDVRSDYTESCYDYRQIAEDSVQKSVIITRYDDDRKNVVRYQCLVKMKKEGQNLFPFLSINDFNGGGGLRRCNNLPKGLVTKVTVLKSKYDGQITLDYQKDVGFAIKIPD